MKNDPLMALFGNAAKREPRPSIVPEAQRDDLLSRTEAIATPTAPRFERRDFVVFREGLGPFKKEFMAETQFMFWGYVNADDAFIQARLRKMPYALNYPAIDCMIAYLEDGGVTFDLAWSPMLRHGHVG